MEKLQNIEQGSTKMRLLEFLDYKKIKPGRFEKICGLANAFVRNMRKSIDPETFDEKISPKFPELSKVWLLFGEGEMLNDLKGLGGVDVSTVGVPTINSLVQKVDVLKELLEKALMLNSSLTAELAELKKRSDNNPEGIDSGNPKMDKV